jgi:hypothetical protein
LAPPTDPLSQDTHNNSATRGRGEGGGARPRTTKAHDPTRTQRQLEHTQRKEQAAAAVGPGVPLGRRSAWQPSQRTTQTPPQPIIPPTLPPLQPPNPDTLNSINPPPPNPTEFPDEERFYDTEIEEELELPATSQVSGSKKLLIDPLEDENTSKKYRTEASPKPLNE